MMDRAFYRTTIRGGAWAADGLDIWAGRLSRIGATDVELVVAANGIDVEGTFWLAANPLGAHVALEMATGGENFKVDVG